MGVPRIGRTVAPVRADELKDELAASFPELPVAPSVKGLNIWSESGTVILSLSSSPGANVAVGGTGFLRIPKMMLLILTSWLLSIAGAVIG